MGNVKAARKNTPIEEQNEQGEISSIFILKDVIKEEQVNLRPKLKIKPEDKQREINSFKGSFRETHVETTDKSNYAFSAHVTGVPSVLLKSRHQKPIFEFRFAKSTRYSSSGRYYISKSKLGLETMVYGSQMQLNCFFSRVSFKRLLSATSTQTYAINGHANSAILVSLKELHKWIAMLMKHRARFELKHDRSRQCTILTYHFPDHHCLRLENTDLAGDLDKEVQKAINRNWHGFIHYLVFHDRKLIVSYNKETSKEEILLIVYKVTDEPSLRTIFVGSLKIPKEILFGYYSPQINEKVSENIELITLEFNDRTRYYNVTDEGVLEMVYEYAKRREYSISCNPIKEKIRLVRRGDIVTICEQVSFSGTYELEKFKL